MASGVNVKMGVEGISQFKNDMKTAQTAVKTLDQQLALNEKQFKATGDAEGYMQQKTELLQMKLQEQKTIIANAEKALADMTSKGVDRASDAFQKMQQQLIKAKGDMLDTEAAMNNVGIAGDEAAKSADAMNQQLKRIGDGVNWQNVTEGLDNLTNGLENVAKKAISVGRKVIDTMLGAGAWADNLQTDATVYGISVEDLQRMQKTADLIDTSVDSILTSQKKLRKGLGSGDAGVMGAFAELMPGYDPRTAGWEDAFWKAGEALMHFTDEEEKEVYAQKLFGQSWNDLIPLFEAGREQYEEMNASWNVLSEEQVKSLGDVDDAYQTLMNNVETLKLKMLSEFAEPFAALLETINTKLGEFSAWLESDEGKAMVNNVVASVQGALEWIADPENIQKVIRGVEAIAIGWGAIKLTGGALQLLQLVNGLTGIMGGSAAGSGVGSGLFAGVGGFIAKAAPWAVGLGVLTKNAFTPQGNDDIWDENGNPTELGRELGYTWTLEQDRILGEYKKAVQATNEPYGTVFTGDTEAAEARNERWRQNVNALERMQAAAEDLSHVNEGATRSTSEMTQAASDLKGLPAATAAAVISGMSGLSLYMDGEAVARILTPRIGGGMGVALKAVIK